MALLTFTGCLFYAVALTAAEKPQKESVKWLYGPGVAPLKQTAEIKLPSGYKFADGETTQRLLKAAGEPTTGRELGMMMPEDGDWTVFFEFSDEGYVKDDDKDKLDPDKLLKANKKGNDYANQQRKKMGTPSLDIVGWEQKPAYDPETHNLQWAIRAESEGRPIINYNTRLLGRKGVMEVVLVCKPEALGEIVPTFKSLLADYSFKTGERYAEYKPGDKLAKYGLAALVTGGAVAVAAKTGFLAVIVAFFKKGAKLIIIGVIAIAAFFRKLIFGRSAAERTE